jgi:hypothetical protein
MMVGQSFMQNMMGKDVWIPEADDQSMMGFWWPCYVRSRL